MSTSIFDWFQLFAENAWLYGGAFVLVLSVLVFVHEWGHYIVARKCGVKIDSFSIGFGKELFGYTDKNGTRWKFSLIPLGGYVKMFGDVDPASTRHVNGVEEEETRESGDPAMRPLTEEERAVAFYSQPLRKRAAIVAAGPGINFLFAIILLAGLYMFHGQPVTPPVAAAVVGGSAAHDAGFRPHDEVIAIDGERILRFEEIRREVMIGLDQARIFTLLRDGQEVEVEAAPAKLEERDHFGFRHSRGMLGLISPGNAIDIRHITAIDGTEYEDASAVRQALLAQMNTEIMITLDRGIGVDELYIRPLSATNEALRTGEGQEGYYLVIADMTDEVLVRHNVLSAPVMAARETWNITTSTLRALGQMFTGTRSATELGGIIRIGAIAGDMAKMGLVALITFTALLSINLGLINLFPIPMLDGGHLVFYGVEAVKGGPISEPVQEYAFRLGLVILVGIMLFANLNDVVQLLRL